MKYLCILFLLLFSTNVLATNWYVEKNAVGLNNGTSWENAWNELDQIRWTSIRPGDTIYLSGGSNGLDYNTKLTASTAGTQQSPILIKSSQESNRNGIIRINKKISIWSSWVSIDGAKSDSFETDIPVSQLDSMLDNINIEIHDPFDGGINITSPTGVKIKWVYIHDSADQSSSVKGEFHGITHNYSATPQVENTNIEISYSIIKRNYGDGINFKSNAPTQYGDFKIHHVIVTENSDDGVQGAGGIDISYSRIGRPHPTRLSGHPDAIQIADSFDRIYNNEIISASNSIIYSELRPQHSGNILIYGNLGRSEARIPPYGISLGVQYNTGDPLDATYENIVVTGNTLYKTQQSSITISNAGNISSENLSEVYISNNIIVDAGLGSSYPVLPDPNAASALTIRGPAKKIFYSNEDIQVRNNIFTGFADNITYKDIFYPTPSDFDNNTGNLNNSNTTPLFVTGSLHLSQSDTIAKDNGVHLDQFIPQNILAMMPDFDRDMEGKNRGQGAGWDIGAFEFSGEEAPPTTYCGNDIKESGEVCDKSSIGDETCVTKGFSQGKLLCNSTCTGYNTSNCWTTPNPLILNFDFENLQPDYNSTTGIVTDRTQNAVIADCQKNLTLFNGTTIVANDQCPSTTTRPAGGNAAKFSGGQLCQMNSDYLSFNGNVLREMPAGTIALWGQYDDNSFGGATLIDASGAPDTPYPNNARTWRLGRDWRAKCQLRSTRFMTGGYSLTGNCETGRSDNYFNDYTLLVFPDSYYIETNKKWNHYAITWDGVSVKGYFNGVHFATVSQKNTFTVSDFYVAIGTTMHYGERNETASDCITQYSCPDIGGVCPTPNPEYVFPNNGFFSGTMDDVKIYNTALSQSEINNLFNPMVNSVCVHKVVGIDYNPAYVIAEINKWYAGTTTVQELILKVKIWKYCSP